MATEQTRPTTLAGVKRLAKFIKRTQSIPHHAALDVAAQKAGFQNLRHAQAVLEHSACGLHQAFLTFYWQEREGFPDLERSSPVLRSGRTTFTFFLPVPLQVLLPGKSLERTPYLPDLRLEAPDHLERRRDAFSEYEGVKMAQQAALALNFMAATGLRAPLARESLRPKLKLCKNADHCSYWYDDESKCIVTLDEPYRALFEDEIAWADAHGFHTVGVPWRGIYGGNKPRLHTLSDAILPRLVAKLEALEARLKNEEWTYESQAYESQFISPARALSGKRRTPRIMPTPQGVEHSGAVPCGPGEPGYRSRWRPARRMSLDRHLHIGAILSGLTADFFMSQLGPRIGQIADTLHSWFWYEYAEAELPSKESRHIYGSPPHKIIRGAADQLAALAEVRQTVVEGYQDCKPKKGLLESIDRADRWIRLNKLN